MSDDINRDYGQGTFGTESKVRAKRSVGARVKYLLDNALSSKKRFVGMVLLAMVLLAIIMTGIQALIAVVEFLNADATGAENYFNVFWASFSRILSLGGEATWGQRILGFLYWAIAIAVTGTVIGFITSVIQLAVARLGRGLSPVIDSGHTLILGWSPRLFPILKELVIAKSSERNPLVVVFSDIPRQQMEDEIGSRVPELGKLRVVTRHGSLTNPADVVRANAGEASSIIVLQADDAGDASVVTSILAMRATVGDAHPPVIAEIEDPHIAETMHSATGGRVQSVRSQDIIARVTAQAARQPGLASVVLDLLDFEGNEIYVAGIPELVGSTYGDALLSFNASSVIGIETGVGQSLLNPPAKTKSLDSSKLIFITEDDASISYSGFEVGDSVPKVTTGARTSSPQHLLVVGWSAMGHAVLGHLAEYLPKGSSISILARKEFVAVEDLANVTFGMVDVSLSFVSGDVDEIIAIAEKRQYDEIIVLGYRSRMSRSDADAHTLLTMLQMNHLFADDSNKVSRTRIVAEILDSSLLPLARAAAADDLVVSDVLAALLISQLSQNPRISKIINDLFDAEGAGIHLVPVENFVALGTTCRYRQLVAIGCERGVTVVGYRVAEASATETSAGVCLNPFKERSFTAARGDGIIVIRQS
jgi:hypothetical protein